MLTTLNTPSALAAFMRNNKKYLMGLHIFTLVLLSVTAFGQTMTNPVDKQRFFVWQQYRDALERAPEQSGLYAWVDYINSMRFE
jgi:hypothetical protein